MEEAAFADGFIASAKDCLAAIARRRCAFIVKPPVVCDWATLQ
jgi:hypothetical protein